MPIEFPAKTWMLRSRLLIITPLALTTLILSLLFWTGILTDANHQPRPAAGPPMFITSLILLALAAQAGFQLFAYRTPVIRCFQQGIECNLVGRTSLDNKDVPAALRMLWSILSLQGFRSRRHRIPWADFRGAQVAGLPMSLLLRLHRTASTPIVFQQHTFKTHPNNIVQALNHFALSPHNRAQLPAW